MLGGWPNQRLARNLARSTIEGRGKRVRAFAACDAFPWHGLTRWSTSGSVISSGSGLKHSTMRSFSEAVPGVVPTSPTRSRVVGASKAVRHAPDPGGDRVEHRRARPGHEADPASGPSPRGAAGFFDHADERSNRIRGPGRKGWLPAFRDARCSRPPTRSGCAQRDSDAGRRRLRTNPRGPGVRRLRGPGGPATARPRRARRPSAAACWPSGTGPRHDREWITEVRPLFGSRGEPGAWPSERGRRLGVQRLDSRFGAYRDELGLDGRGWISTRYAGHVTHLSRTAGTRGSSSTRSATNTPPPQPSTPAFRPTSAPAPCGGPWTPPPGGTARPEGTSMTANAQISYRWRLRELMATRGMFTVGELVPLLIERGITCPPPRSTAWSPAPPNDCPCPFWPRSATSSTSPPPTSFRPRPRRSRPAKPPPVTSASPTLPRSGRGGPGSGPRTDTWWSVDASASGTRTCSAPAAAEGSGWPRTGSRLRATCA